MLAVVECSLGGALGDALTDVPGASAWFAGGIAPYSAKAKEALLGLTRAETGEAGVVSALAARLLADAGKRRLGADWVLAETGIAGPRGSHRSAKDPGIAFLCLLGPGEVVHQTEVATGLDDRVANKRAFLAAALDLLSAI